jgi:hypothetical protein
MTLELPEANLLKFSVQNLIFALKEFNFDISDSLGSFVA